MKRIFRYLRRLWLSYKLRQQLNGAPFDQDFSLAIDREDAEAGR